MFIFHYKIHIDLFKCTIASGAISVMSRVYSAKDSVQIIESGSLLGFRKALFITLLAYRPL